MISKCASRARTLSILRLQIGCSEHTGQAMGYTGGRSMLRYYIQPKRKMRPSKRTVRFETQPGYQLQHDQGEVEVEVAGQRCKVNFAVNTLRFSRRFHVFAAPKQDAEHTPEQEHLQPLPSSALSAVSTVNFVSIREN